MTTQWMADKLAQAELRIEAAEKNLALNAKMLAKQCDLARQAEIDARAWRMLAGRLEVALRDLGFNTAQTAKEMSEEFRVVAADHADKT